MTENTITMRTPCPCGGTQGHIETRGGQDCVYCTTCSQYRYNAPRTETGRKKRSLSSREGITPSARARILDRYQHACVNCGRRAPEVRLELDHIIPRHLAHEHNMLDDIIDSEWNLAPACAECNSGRRSLNHPQLQLLYRCILVSSRAGGA